MRERCRHCRRLRNSQNRRRAGDPVAEIRSAIGHSLERNGFTLLSLTLAHTAALERLPPLHRDPFDRMLIAQAQVEGLAIVTADRRFLEYDVAVIDARR